MLATRVGYTGGSQHAPTYHSLGDHVEAVEVVFDPQRLTYEELLAVFWRSHPAWLPAGPRRAATAVFVHDEAQRRAALASKADLEARSGEPVKTEVLAAGTFWPAEPVHQKWNLQRLLPDLVREQAIAGTNAPSFLDSTAAAKLNSYLGSFAGAEAVATAAAALELEPAELQRRLDAAREP